jgi:hypothetical protein
MVDGAVVLVMYLFAVKNEGVGMGKFLQKDIAQFQ